MKTVIVGILMLCAMVSYAAFGGGRSGGFSGGRSYGGGFTSGRSVSSGNSFGGFRASPSATISRPAPAYSARSAGTVIVNPAPIVHYNNGGGFWSGWMWGHMMGHNQTIVTGTAGTPIVVQDQTSGWFILGTVAAVVFIVIVLAVMLS